MSAIGDITKAIQNDAAAKAIHGDRVGRLPLRNDVSYPHVAIELTGVEREDADDGPLDLATMTLNIECWAKKAGDADGLAEAIRLALYSKRKVTIGLTYFEAIFLENERDIGSDEVPDAFAREMEFRAVYREATA